MKQHDERECDARDLRALELLDELLADIEADERSTANNTWSQ